MLWPQWCIESLHCFTFLLTRSVDSVLSENDVYVSDDWKNFGLKLIAEPQLNMKVWDEHYEIPEFASAHHQTLVPMLVLVVWIHVIAYKHLFILMFGYKTWYVNQPILLFLSSYFFIHSFFLQILFINLWKRKIKIVKIIIISLNWMW